MWALELDSWVGSPALPFGMTLDKLLNSLFLSLFNYKMGIIVICISYSMRII